MSNNKSRFPKTLYTCLNEHGYVDICPVSNIKINTFQIKGNIKNFGLRRFHKASQERDDLRGV